MNKLLSTLGAIALGLVAAATFTSGAQAERPDDRAGLLGVGGALASVADSGAIRPDDRSGPRGVGSVGVVGTLADAPVRPDDRAGSRSPVAFSESPTSVIAIPGDGFQWEDAMIGGGLTAGVLMLMGALALTVRHRRRVALS